MRQVSARTREIIRDGGFDIRWVADLMYDGARRLENVELEEQPDLRWDGDRFVLCAGSAKIVWSDDFGSSFIPREVGDWFSPFGAELQIDCIVGTGVFAERVPQGRFVVTDVPDVTEAQMLWGGRLINPGESFTVSLMDRLAKVQRDDFGMPTAPRSTSTWGEIQALTGMPVVRNIPDANVGAITYEGPKTDALKALFDRLDAWAHPDSSGALTARPKAWGEPVDELVNVVVGPPSMTAQYTYNRVVVKGKSPDGEPLYGIREVTQGFLRVRNMNGSQSPFGGATYTYSDNLGVLDTQAKVDAYAAELLPRVARLRSVKREVIETANPLREVGDVLTFADTRRFGSKPVRVLTVEPAGARTVLTVEVPDA